MLLVVPAGLTQVARAAGLMPMRLATWALTSRINVAISRCRPASNDTAGCSIMPVIEMPSSASRLAMRVLASPR